MLAALLCLACVPVAQEDGASLADEWRVRSWAADTALAASELDGALASEDWTERYHALDALRRAGEGHADLASLLADPHGNVRAMALRVARRRPQGAQLSAGVAVQLASDPLAEVREQLVMTLGAEIDGMSGRQRAKLLFRLAHDADLGVSDLARQVLFSSYGFGAEHVRLLREVDVVGRRRMLLDYLPYLLDAPPEVYDLEGLSQVTQDDGPGAVALVQLITRRLGDWFADPYSFRADRQALVRGWIDFHPALFESRDHGLEAARSKLFATAAADDVGLGRDLAFAGLELFAHHSGESVIGTRFPEHVAHSEASYDDPLEATWILVQSAAQALSAEYALDLFSSAPPELASIVWQEVGTRIEDWSPSRLNPWIKNPDDSVRFLVAQGVSDALIQDGEVQLGPFLVDMLAEDDPLSSSAFRWLCGARVERERWMTALHAAWLEYPRARQLERLRDVPRDIAPVAFRGQLLAFLAEEDGREPSVIELLATFAGDDEVERALERALREEQGRLEERPPLAEFQKHEWQAKGLLRALHGMRGERFVGFAAEMLERTLAAQPALADGEVHDPELPKTCAWVLGQTAAGRAKLATWQTRDVPRRVRVEIALALVRDASAVQTLVHDYEGCDAELRIRILDAFGRTADDAGRGFLVRVAGEETQTQSERIAALESLRRREAVGELADVLGSARNIDVRRAGIQYLAELGTTGGARERLLAAWQLHQAAMPIGGGPDMTELLADWRLLRGELLVALARLAPLDPELLAECFRIPLLRAESDLRQRFRGERGPSVSFVWRAELDLAVILAERGRLGLALETAGDWSRMDGRFLYGMAEAVRESGSRPEVLAGLYRAALVALAGEGDTQGGTRLSIGATLRLAELAEHDARWADFRHWTLRLLAAEHSGPGSETAFAHYMGSYDRRAGVDPHARLYSARVQAAAWEAKASGNRGLFQELVAEAASLVGVSRLAREAQTRLEEHL